MAHFFERTPIAELYRWFAGQTRSTSPTWERLCLWIAAQHWLIERLDALPGQARQPNRFLAALQFHGAPLEPGSALHEWLEHHWEAVRQTIVERPTQTNEPGRLSALAPLWASLPQPVSLLELGASAGLCLLPDLLGFDDVTVAERLGIDSNPLDPRDEDTRRWLCSLVWPGEDHRRQRLQRALNIAANQPPEVRVVDLEDEPERWIPNLVDELRARSPETTVVVFHSMVLGYLPRAKRQAVADAVRGSGARWVAFEPRQVLAPLCAQSVPDAPPWGDTLLTLDGVPRAWCQPHGLRVEWISPG